MENNSTRNILLPITRDEANLILNALKNCRSAVEVTLDDLVKEEHGILTPAIAKQREESSSRNNLIEIIKRSI
jgi:hypothetical protein